MYFVSCLEKIEGDSLLKRYEPLVSHFYTSLSSAFSNRDPTMEGLFGQELFSEGGGDCGNEVDSLRVYPIDTVESRDIVVERGLEEVPVLLEDTTLCQEEQKEGTWEESCLLMFSRFLGFSIDGYEDEIFNMMNSICERRSIVKGKGVQGTRKFDRERKKLEWNMKEKAKSGKGGSSQRGKGVHSGW